MCDHSKKEMEQELQRLRKKVEDLEKKKEQCRETEEILGQSEERFRILFEYAPDGYYINDLKGTFIDGNRAAEKISGYRREELIGKSFLKLGILPLKYVPLAVRNLAKNLCGRPTGPDEMELKKKDGTHVWVEISTHPIVLEGKHVVLGIARDITQRKEAEKALAESEARYRDLFENANDLIQSVSSDGRIQYVNARWLATMKYTSKEAALLYWEDIIHESCLEKCGAVFEKVRNGGEVNGVEAVFVSKDGKKIFVEGSVNGRFENGEFVGTRGIFRNVTEQRKMEEELSKSQRLDSLGILAGGIAHDFNNILMGIAGNIGLARLKVDGASEVYDFLSKAEKSAIKGKKLTQQLLTFASGGAPAKKPVRILPEIRKAAEFALSGSKVKADIVSQDEDMQAEIDTSQFNQALCNILINAQEEMDDGGTVSISTEKLEITEDNSTHFLPGTYVQISVRDRGRGISEDVISRIFDPFFSTKKGSKGMGLSVAYSIINKHAGYLMADSNPGQGAVFCIMLPSAEGKIHTTEIYNVHTEKRTGKILVMDDEEVIRSVACNILKELGYTADAACDGEEMLRMYAEADDTGEPYDAVIMDLTVPGGMGGEEAIGKLLEMDPDARAVVSSGYSNSPVFANYSRHGFRACMPKPYEIEELKHILVKVMK